jgi:ATP phosphoribosyltransferase
MENCLWSRRGRVGVPQICMLSSDTDLTPSSRQQPLLGSSSPFILQGAGLDFVRPNRLDVATCTRLPVTLVFLPAADIATYVAEGNVDMGITGQDIIAESQVEVTTLQTMGMGHCELCVQAPVGGAITEPKHLAGKRIVTSFPNLSKAFFEQFEDDDETRIKCVSGSVEVACSLGLADGIVDLVETGTTMRAAGLQKIGLVMATETVLIANTSKVHKPLVQKINKRIQGFLKAQKNSMMAYNIASSELKTATAITPGANGPTINKLEGPGDKVSVTVMVKSCEVADIMDRLEDLGATGLVVFDVTNCRI